MSSMEYLIPDFAQIFFLSHLLAAELHAARLEVGHRDDVADAVVEENVECRVEVEDEGASGRNVR